MPASPGHRVPNPVPRRRSREIARSAALLAPAEAVAEVELGLRLRDQGDGALRTRAHHQHLGDDALGDAHPLVPNDSAENRAQNRRVEITIRQDHSGTGPVKENVAAYAGDLAVEAPTVSAGAPPSDGEPAASPAPSSGPAPGAAADPSASGADDDLPDWVPRPPTLSAPAPSIEAPPPADAGKAAPGGGGGSRLDKIRSGFNG